MSFQPVPWAVKGAAHSPTLARQMNHSALGGQTGITGPDSLQVVESDPTAGTVRVMPGSGTVTYAQGQGGSQDRAYVSAPDQLVQVRNDAAIDVDVSPTTSAGGRTDMVVVEVDDPEFEGDSDTTDFDSHEFVRVRVIQNVGSSAVHPWELSSLPRPVLPLARLHIPASTTVITDEMIRDIRRIASPKSDPVKLLAPANPGGGDIEIGPTEDTWQTIMSFDDVTVPDWATRARVSMTITHAYAVGGRVGGLFRVLTTGQNSSVATEAMSFIATNDSERFSMHCAGNINLNWRTAGATSRFELQVQRIGDPANRPGTLRIPDFTTHTSMADGWCVYEEAPRATAEGA